MVKAIERINKRPLTRGLGRIARGTKGEMQTRIIQKQLWYVWGWKDVIKNGVINKRNTLNDYL